MINLLPPREKKELLREKTERLTIILGGIFLIFLICLILVLFAVKTYIWGQVESKTILLNQIKKEYQNSNIQELEGAIEEYNTKIIQVDNFYNKQVYFTESIEEVSQLKPDGIYFIYLSLKRNADNSITFSISGFSETRDNLTLYKNNLENQKEIKEIKFSPLSWAKPTDISFQVTFNFEK